MKGNKIIEVKDLTFKYNEDGKEILKNISFSVNAGEYIAIVGHNGSGKSTLAKQLNGILTPTSGQVLIDNLDTKDEKNSLDIKKRVGMVFQNPDNQIVATLVEEDVAFAPENLGIEREKLRGIVDNALKAVDMYEYRNRAPSNLSGGQKQRVAIAGILAMNPNCIVLDEATAMLDPKGREEVIDVIKNLNDKENKTIINITHFMEEAAKADRIIVLNKGEILIDDKPKEVFKMDKKLKDIGLDIPQLTSFSNELKRLNITNEEVVITVDECVEMLKIILKDEK